MMLEKNIMWQAVVDCDASFDGKFFYAVKTTGVYCRPGGVRHAIYLSI